MRRSAALVTAGDLPPVCGSLEFLAEFAGVTGAQTTSVQ